METGDIMLFKEINNKYSVSNVRIGIIRTKNLSDELDSMTVVLSHITTINIEPYDLIQLTNENGVNEYWLVANYTKNYVNYDAPYKFDYTVDLMSCTKWLEMVQLPSMTITNIGQNRSIRSYIERIVSRYVVPDIGYISTVTYTLDTRFDNVCPEMTFSQPTAREYLDWMVANYGCIIKASYVGNATLNIGVLDLNELKGALPIQYIKNMTEVQNAEDYVTQFDHTLDNVIGQGTIREYVKLKSDGYVFNSDEAVAILSYKPYDIVKVILKTNVTIRRHQWFDDYGSGVDVVNNIQVTNLDLTDFFVIDNIANTLEMPPYSLSETRSLIYSQNTTASDLYIGNKYKTNCMVWQRGNRIISNFNYTETFKKWFGSGVTETAIEQAIVEAYLKSHWYNDWDDSVNMSIFEEYSVTDYDWKNLILEIEYKPYLSARIDIEQKEKYNHLVTMQDNSTNALTDIASFINQSIEKNSKLGNKSKIFTARNTITNNDYAPKYEIGQYWYDEIGDKYILSTLEYETKLNSILYKGTLTKNYTNRFINAIINREKRYYSLADSSEMVTRNEIFKTDIKISLSDSSPYTYWAGILLAPAVYFSFQTRTSSEKITDGIIMAETLYGDNIVSFTASFQDNVIYASVAGEETSYSNGSGFKMNIKKYVDDNGEFQRMRYACFCFLWSDINETNISATEIDNLSKFKSPSGMSLSNSRTINILKDSRERIAITEICKYSSDDSNIIVGKIGEITQFYGSSSKKINVVFSVGQNNYSINCTHKEFITCAWVASLINLIANFQLAMALVGQLIVKNVDNEDIIYLTINNYKLTKYLSFDVIERT